MLARHWPVRYPVGEKGPRMTESVVARHVEATAEAADRIEKALREHAQVRDHVYRLEDVFLALVKAHELVLEHDARVHVRAENDISIDLEGERRLTKAFLERLLRVADLIERACREPPASEYEVDVDLNRLRTIRLRIKRYLEHGFATPNEQERAAIRQRLATAQARLRGLGE